MLISRPHREEWGIVFDLRNKRAMSIDDGHWQEVGQNDKGHPIFQLLRGVQGEAGAEAFQREIEDDESEYRPGEEDDSTSEDEKSEVFDEKSSEEESDERETAFVQEAAARYEKIKKFR